MIAGAAAPDARGHIGRSVEQMGPNHLHALGPDADKYEGWIWIMPDASGTVLIPAQALENARQSRAPNPTSPKLMSLK